MSEAPGASALSFRTDDGVELSALRYGQPATARGGVLIAPAMGVPQAFYAAFAQWLAGQGWLVMSFDYRGMGASREGSLRGLKADVMTWAQSDLDAMLREARSAGPGLPAFALGHSLGGQLFGAVREGSRLDAIVTVTAGSGWYRHNHLMPLQVRFFWFVAIPLLTPLFGYFPGKRLRMVGDLPAGVAWQWRRWGTHPEYLLCEGEEMRRCFDAVGAPVLGFSFEDDAIITQPAVDQLHGFYRNARVERRHLAPRDAGRARIGHFGYFLPASRDNLWRDTLDWLRSI